MKFPTLSSSVEAIFIVLLALETNLEIDPNSVTKWGNQSQIIISNPNKLHEVENSPRFTPKIGNMIYHTHWIKNGTTTSER